MSTVETNDGVAVSVCGDLVIASGKTPPESTEPGGSSTSSTT